ncbi:MAG: hypothetical protein RR382_12925 [Tannerellaceae bacterium]
MNKAIYKPKGKAGEYARYACNFFVGCSNDCSYCYCKKGVLGHAMGGAEVKLKKCFKDKEHAFQVFQIEAINNLQELRKHGLFFTFTSDPLLSETIQLTLNAIRFCVEHDIKVKVLSKCADNIEHIIPAFPQWKNGVAFGFTLTGHDELEPNASTNDERIQAMMLLKMYGYKTFASIEPIVDLDSSMDMIEETAGYCDLYKIGLMSGKEMDKYELLEFVGRVLVIAKQYNFKVYLKDSVTKIIGETESDRLVSADYDLFEKGGPQ